LNNSRTLFAILLIACLGSSLALTQTDSPETNPVNWNGTWLADGTLFSIAVTVTDNEFNVEVVQSLGFVWTAKLGDVNGNRATIEVTYLGATAMIVAELTGDGTAIAYADTCLPDFMVVCALAKDRQAAFSRIEN
jgi:hypothetical protein